MRRVIGFALFFAALGMIVMMFVDDLFAGVLFVIIFLLLGYHFFFC